MWMIPNMWTDSKADKRNRDVQVIHKVDGVVKYCTTCEHCFEKRHYTEKSATAPLYLYYSDFPKIGKPKVESCPKCS
jgi:hypothetical protein